MGERVTISIPDYLSFSDLHLARERNGNVSFQWEVIEYICSANGLPSELFSHGPEENVTDLIVRWYLTHRQGGGVPDPVAEDLIAEMLDEELAGQTVSYQPGQA